MIELFQINNNEKLNNLSTSNKVMKLFGKQMRKQVMNEYEETAAELSESYKIQRRKSYLMKSLT